ncbi:DUF1499 domain-containing protein [Dongia rigui]|uniref:DUF1499 domain-containing protein n=1 Tax=Dongia rigui TaxID=940149 RepID=A0ABU5DUC8_9PROT|nr:DUF1499 domain-containing protein [Dongia rigui]MDY0870917.1 DUF1499 domain-containing protein [Dongia rigui]
MSYPLHPPRRKRPILGLLCCFCLIAAGCSADTARIDFSTFARATTPNDALACPTGLCAAKADFVTDAVALSATDLAAKARALLSSEPRTELASQSEEGLHLVFVQRSRLFRFPDTVNIAVLPAGDGQANLAIYSRSNYGHGDLGVNRRRVEAWLQRLGIPYRAAS